MSFDDPFTGILTRLSRIPRAAADPDISIWGGSTPSWGPRSHERPLGGAGWDDEAARSACIGEAIERLQSYPLPGDEVVRASLSRWSLDEPALGADRWVLFHEDQHRQPGFPFARWTADREIGWACFRDAFTGAPVWIPEEMAYLDHGGSSALRVSPSYSTGLSCGTRGHPLALRGLQEVIERDAVVGAWWGAYGLEEWPASEVWTQLEAGLADRVRRPHRRYRFYRVRSPYSDHATIVTTEGEDRDGFLFAAGSACRETRAASWAKSLLEAIQGAAYVRQLRADRGGAMGWVEDRSDFPQHAAYYTAHPARLRATVLHRASAPEGPAGGVETLGVLRERLGAAHPVLIRIMTPPFVAQEWGGWSVLRVVVPGLQPLHGNDAWPHLGGPLWTKPTTDWPTTMPHPFA